MNPSSKEKLLKFSGKRHEVSFGVDDLNSLMLQIAFAIMMIFMMAYFIFRTESRKKQEEQVLELERQKLVIAVDAVTAEYRARYGLDVLMPSGRTDEPFDASGIVNEGHLTEEPVVKAAFIKSARNGASDFSDVLKLRRDWLDKVASHAQVNESELDAANATWLSQQVDSGIASMETDVRSVEYAGVAELQRYWMRTPSAIEDPKVADILTKFNAADENGRMLLVTELSSALRSHAFSVLSKQTGAELLK